jgi:ribosome-associated heat shock protein Hsp15
MTQEEAMRVTRPPQSRIGSAKIVETAMDEIRIDKWLWAARFFKTRRAATEAVLGGRVLLNEARVKPSKEVRRADVVEVRSGQIRRTVVVTGLADRRGPAKAAAALYEETAESVSAREEQARQRRLAAPLGADLGLRPTKRDRRRLEALRKSLRRAD